MFEAMGTPVAHPAAWDRSCARRIADLLQPRSTDQRLLAIVVDDDRAPGRLAASAMAEVVDRLPGPTDTTARWAYISSVSTDRDHRRRGFARASMTALLAEVRAAGATRIELHATPDGEPLYRELGFAPTVRHPELRFTG
jgi:GNAT superfamily N-acetyltransferase